ncbi:MAG: hypothetical protein R2741_12950 [Methanolobus sp.]
MGSLCRGNSNALLVSKNSFKKDRIKYRHSCC